MLTFLHTMYFDKVWLFYCFQRLALMPRLTSAFSPGSFSQTFRARRRLIVSVAGRRLTAVAAVLCELVFQFLNAFRQRQHCCVEEQDHRFSPLIICGIYFFFPRQL